MKKEKNTRLFYTDEQSVTIWKELSPEQCKEVLLKYLTYNYGDDVVESDFTDKVSYLMFKTMFKPKIDFNEEKWIKKAEQNRNNGKESMGRPRNIIVENRDAINNIVSVFVKGDKKKANEMLGSLISRLGYDPTNPDDDGANYILSYVEKEIERVSK